jgi:hypothetical protein
VFTVPDGSTFTGVAIGLHDTCYETTSELSSGSCGLGAQKLTINGVAMPLLGNWPLPNQRHHGYCIQIEHGLLPLSLYTAN